MINYPKLDYPKLDNFNKKLIFALKIREIWIILLLQKAMQGQRISATE